MDHWIQPHFFLTFELNPSKTIITFYECNKKCVVFFLFVLQSNLHTYVMSVVDNK